MNKIESNTFVFDRFEVFFKHTDCYGFVHPYNYFEWTSYVREAFFSQMCGDFEAILNSSIKMMTAKINADLLEDSKFGDKIEAHFTITKIKKVSFDVIVRFFNKRLRKVVCETQHTLVFVDSGTEKFTQIPDSIRKAVVKHEENGLV